MLSSQVDQQSQVRTDGLKKTNLKNQRKEGPKRMEEGKEGKLTLKANVSNSQCATTTVSLTLPFNRDSENDHTQKVSGVTVYL